MSPFFSAFVVRTTSSCVIGSSVWFVFGTQSWHIKYASGNKARADVPTWPPPTSKQLTSKMPQIRWISSSLNPDSFQPFRIRFTITFWLRFHNAGMPLPSLTIALKFNHCKMCGVECCFWRLSKFNFKLSFKKLFFHMWKS